MGCDWAKTVWFASPLGINFTTNGEESLNFNEWLTKIIIHEARDIVQLVVAICYEIWKVRNKRCFERIDMPNALSVCNSAIKAIHEFNSIDALLLRSVINPIPVPVSAVRWTSPIGNSFKMNVDPAGPNSDGKWGLAAVIRDTEGVVVAAKCWCILTLPDSDVAEGLALLKGLEFAKDMVFLKLIVESDSFNIITCINENQRQLSYLGSIVEDCKRFVSSFQRLEFCHARREANQAAHYLAKFALLSCTDFIWIEETPPCISAVVAFDLLPPLF